MHAADLLAARRKIGERRDVLFQQLEARQELAKRPVRETGPHAARVAQFAVVMIAEQQRPKTLPGARRIRVSADHELGMFMTLELEPISRPARDIWPIAAL